MNRQSFPPNPYGQGPPNHFQGGQRMPGSPGWTPRHSGFTNYRPQRFQQPFTPGSSPGQGPDDRGSPWNQRPRQSSTPIGGRFVSPGHQSGQSRHRFQSPTSPSPRQQYRGSPRFHRSNSDHNPGGSNSIQDYYCPSFVQDPWRNVTPVPVTTICPPTV